MAVQLFPIPTLLLIYLLYRLVTTRKVRYLLAFVAAWVACGALLARLFV